LKGGKIPLQGRITILADVFDALSSKRVYKEAMPEAEVLRILAEGRGTHFDPALLDVFVGALEEVRGIKDRYSDREEDFDKLRNLEAREAEEEEASRA
jgi:putative two-component system response regulator